MQQPDADYWRNKAEEYRRSATTKHAPHMSSWPRTATHLRADKNKSPRIWPSRYVLSPSKQRRFATCKCRILEDPRRSLRRRCLRRSAISASGT